MKNFTKFDVLDAVHSKNGIAKITFRKKDGSIREMYASLHKKNLIPTKGTSKKSRKAENLMTVVDVEKNEWRSFYVDDVIDIKRDVRRSYGARIGEEVVSFSKRSDANKARKLIRELTNHLLDTAFDIR